ncbi:type III secretion system export apparatus subunit SctU [Desulfovibrio inopinatus]|uniref:type III secretion system export apparatus subunit SctU n=1 Tax=Desulfovibrio inopinatus TaxID=102109 RepID=UPI00041109DB|nr:type III secretion system export apparatus subunit SctU [Desulfovibrio inopinatus]
MSEKTEKPTPKKLQDARKKGQIAKSQDIRTAAVMAASICYVWLGWDFMYKEFSEMFHSVFEAMQLPFPENVEFAGPVCLRAYTSITYMLCGVVIVASLASGLGHVGFLLVFSSIAPALKNVNPTGWVKKVFSIKGLFQFCMSILKTLGLGVVLGAVIYSSQMDLFDLSHRGVEGIWAFSQSVLWTVGACAILLFVLFAVIDFLFQKQQMTKQLMMSKDEVKREYKEQEGDPEIKAKRRQMAQEIAMSDASAQVRKSSVLVTNPEHLAIALRYNEGKDDLPVVMAKGKGLIARRMREVAEEEGIPIMQNVPLAHDLYEQGRVMDYIPSDLIEPVAEVLVWVREIAAKHGG